MKLYTEEQVLKFINDNFDEGCSNLNELTPIKVPSDEEIDNESESIFYNDRKFKPTIYEIMALRIGAKWMRDKIGGNNEQ